MATRSVTVISVGANALSDHLGRLYDQTYPNHVDIPDARIDVIRWGKNSAKIEITARAIAEWIDDMDYQIEFTEDSAYKSRCQRALAKLLAAQEEMER